MNSEDWIVYRPACRQDEISVGQTKLIPFDDCTLCLAQTERGYFAVDNECPHAGASLAHGYLEGESVACRIHHWKFSLADGRYQDEDRPKCNLNTYPVRVVDGVIEVGTDGKSDTVPSRVMQLITQISRFDASCTLEAFVELLEKSDLPSAWDESDAGSGFSIYTWPLDGLHLHAYFCDGIEITNRFGPVVISKEGELKWQWSPNASDFDSLRGELLSDVAQRIRGK